MSNPLYITSDFTSIFEAAKQGKKRIEIQGKNVSIRRMECFAYKGTVCVRCHIVGNVMILEEWPNKSLHLDLYNLNQDKRTLLTLDHIIPKSKGGKDHLTNYQPMCQICNTAKGNTLEGEK